MYKVNICLFYFILEEYYSKNININYLQITDIGSILKYST